jgi:hypothetical protein
MALLIASVLAGAAACASLLGIEELGVRSNPEAGSSDVSSLPPPCGADAADASFCQQQCPPPDFCDDFEGEGPQLERWNGGAGTALGYPNRVIDHDAGVIDLVPDQVTSSTTLRARAEADDKSAAISFLVHEVKAPPNQLPRGARVEMQGRIPIIDFVQTDAASEDKYVYMLAVGDTVRNEGVGVVLLETKRKGDFDITIQQRGIATSGDVIFLGKLIDGLDIGYFSNPMSWFKLDILIAPETVMKEIGDSCLLLDDDKQPLDAASIPDVPSGGLRVLIKYTVNSRCVPLRGDFAKPDWLPRLTLLTGAVVGNEGKAELRADNVTVRFIY